MLTLQPFHHNAPTVNQDQADTAAMGVFFLNSRRALDLPQESYNALFHEFADRSGLTNRQLSDIKFHATRSRYDGGDLRIDFGQITGQYPPHESSQQARQMVDALFAAMSATRPKTLPATLPATMPGKPPTVEPTGQTSPENSAGDESWDSFLDLVFGT
ncbi:MAG: hypothetical protein KDB00_08335 [Planctomycetales bacterium]|nr:hypothetical protein [Planctomycetales bacterium]